MRILGIDPGSTVTGYGVIDREGGTLRHVAHGTLRPPRTLETAQRLLYIQRGICDVVAEHRPDRAVIEQIFVRASNPRSALQLGQARGAALVALADGGLPVAELSPQQVKMAVVGTGAAQKDQVQHMVTRLLGLARAPAQDAADALAAAIGSAHQGRLAGLEPRTARSRSRGSRSGGWVVRRGR